MCREKPPEAVEANGDPSANKEGLISGVPGEDGAPLDDCEVEEGQETPWVSLFPARRGGNGRGGKKRKRPRVHISGYPLRLTTLPQAE